MILSESATGTNLMLAFAGESQAGTRYRLAAAAAKAETLPCIAKVFQYTAGQELAHSAVFRNRLKGIKADSLSVCADFPAADGDDVQALLNSAAKFETDEAELIYPAFADKARQEGFSQIADSFAAIAEIERIHARRFKMLAELMAKGQLFSSPEDTDWLCLNCGHLYHGAAAPGSCPVCGHPQGFFIRADLSFAFPFEGKMSRRGG
ncbi:MAG: rubrerythrin family protein [Oscillospiraceae bacterium]|nr:rubrerythrin family protein [Oscillospiraceae bacterium]